MIEFAKPDIRSEDIFAVMDLLRTSDRLTDGNQCRNFEKEFRTYLDANYCISTSSCMAALHLAYLTLELKSGDEVICPAMSHVATAHAIELVGATPVFVGCNEVNGNIDTYQIEKSITRKTKAITLVHYLGIPCDMKRINELAQAYDLKVVEDCALSLGSKYEEKYTGTLGDIAAFSFYPSKHVTTGEGGMFVCKDFNLYQKAKSIASFGKQGGNYDYNINYLGSNFRMSEVQACLGISQLKRIEEYKKKRQENYQAYRELIPGNTGFIKFDSFPENDIVQIQDINPYCYCVIFNSKESRDRRIEVLKNNQIGCSIYYPHPIPRLNYYKNKYGFQQKLFSNAISIADRTIALPLGPHITKNDIEKICNIL